MAQTEVILNPLVCSNIGGVNPLDWHLTVGSNTGDTASTGGFYRYCMSSASTDMAQTAVIKLPLAD